MKDKPTLVVDVANDGRGALPALDALSVLDDAPLYHGKYLLRHPLGVYNLSIARVCAKLTACAARLETLQRSASSIEGLERQSQLRDELVDYLELSLYAAAEHVDDAENIARAFYASTHDLKKASAAKALLKDMKVIRDRISAITNALKHAQARLRLYSIDFTHDGNPLCLHGLFVESVDDDGVIGPSPIFHSGIEKVISIPSFLWEIVIYLYEMSVAIQSFIIAANTMPLRSTEARANEPFCKTCISIARLPNYSFDGAHAFDRVRLMVVAGEGHDATLASGLYGSIRRPWSRAEEHSIGKHATWYLGDGVSKQFRLVQPSSIRLQHWE
jgi:hypothetical protein